MRMHPRMLTRSGILSTKSFHTPSASGNRPFRPVMLNSNMHLQERTHMTCHKCGKLGHIATQCYAKAQNFPLGQFQNRPPQNPVRNIQEIKDQGNDTSCLEFQEMSYEEIDEQLNYEETAEFQTFEGDYYPSEVNTQTE